MAKEHWLFRLGILRRTGPGEVGKVDPPMPEDSLKGRNWELGPIGSWLLWPVIWLGAAAMFGLLYMLNELFDVVF